MGRVENLPSVKNHRSKVWILGKLWLHLDLSFQQNCIKVILVIAVEMALSSFLSKISSFHNHIRLIIFVFRLKKIQLLNNSWYQNYAKSRNATSFGHRSWINRKTEMTYVCKETSCNFILSVYSPPGFLTHI